MNEDKDRQCDKVFLLTVPRTHDLFKSQSVQAHSSANDCSTLTVSVLLPGQFRVINLRRIILSVALQHSHVWSKGFVFVGTSPLETNITHE